jgi:hypothetical protein
MRSNQTLVEDLDETFGNLRKINLKLNTKKCEFTVPSRKLLGSSCLTGGSRSILTRSRQSRTSKLPGVSRRYNASMVASPPSSDSSPG